MLVPKNKRRQKLVEKKCGYPDCGVTFYGIPIAKYCPKHREEKYRIRKRKPATSPEEQNDILKHSYCESITVVKTCALEECDHTFPVKVLPRVYIYPKYCPEHRNEYKRLRHLERCGRTDLAQALRQKMYPFSQTEDEIMETEAA